MLAWIQTFATNEINQRFEILLYTTRGNLTPLSYLTQDPRFRRFKLVSNSWTEIEQYIIGRDSRYMNMLLYPHQKLHILLSSRDMPIQDQLVIDAGMGNPIAQRCVYYYYDDTNPVTLGAALQQLPTSINEPVLVIVN